MAGSRTLATALFATSLIVGCSSGGDKGTSGGGPPPGEEPGGGGAGPFASFDVAANAPKTFTGPRAAVPLPDGSTAMIANALATAQAGTDEEVASPARLAVMIVPAGGGEPRVLYAGDKLVSPFDLDASLDGKTLYVADLGAGAQGLGGILSLPVAGGEPTVAAEGFSPRGVTVGPDGTVFFTGRDKASRKAGLFRLNGTDAAPIVTGKPFVDPSGIAVRKDGGVLVADTSLGDDPDLDVTGAGVVLVKDGAASVFATGFVAGYPAGIALTSDERTLVVSAQAANHSDAVYLFDVAKPGDAPTVVQDKIRGFRDSSAGLKRAHGSDVFAWASLSGNGGGTVYLIRGK